MVIIYSFAHENMKQINKKKKKKKKDKLTRLELTTLRISKPALYPLSYRDTQST